MVSRLSFTIAMTALVCALAGCGGDGGTSGTVVATSTSTPTPPPAAPPPPPPPATGLPIARVSPGGTLAGNIVCAGGDFRYEATADGGRRLVDVTRVGAADPARIGISIAYQATNSFRVDVNGFGGTAFVPAEVKNEAAGSSWPMVYFRKLPAQQYIDEFEINDGNGPLHSLVNVTLGRLSDGASLCFFAAGSDRPVGTLPAIRDLYVVADGLGLFSGVARRIGASTAGARIDGTARTIDLYFDVTAHAAPFGQPSGTMTLGRASARLPLTINGATSGTLTGPGGSSGTIVGRLFENGGGAGFAFDLSYPNGDRIFGSITADSL